MRSARVTTPSQAGSASAHKSLVKIKVECRQHRLRGRFAQSEWMTLRVQPHLEPNSLLELKPNERGNQRGILQRLHLRHCLLRTRTREVKREEETCVRKCAHNARSRRISLKSSATEIRLRNASGPHIFKNRARKSVGERFNVSPVPTRSFLGANSATVRPPREISTGSPDSR